MDFKNLSPAYLSSLGAVLVSALMIGSGVSWMLWVGWLLLLLAVGLNVFAHLVTVSKMKGEPAPAMLTNLEQRFEAMREKAAERSEEPIEGSPILTVTRWIRKPRLSWALRLQRRKAFCRRRLRILSRRPAPVCVRGAA